MTDFHKGVGRKSVSRSGAQRGRARRSSLGNNRSATATACLPPVPRTLCPRLWCCASWRPKCHRLAAKPES